MVYEFKDKVILITGAARGIGANIIRNALDEGAKQVVLLDIDEKNAVELENELNAKHGDGKLKFIKCDVTNDEHFVKNFENVLGDKNNEYVVINCAAILNDSWRTYKKQIELNVTALITGSLKALEFMRKDKGGRGGAIINMSSIAALCSPPYTPVYNATKSAVMQFSVGIGDDEYYLRTGVRVLTICFGATDTGLIASQNMGSFDEEIEQKMSEPLKVFPMQKYGARAYSDLRVQYNNPLRILLGLPWRCIASSMFAERRIDGFTAIKKGASFITRLRASTSSILNVFTDRWESPMLRH